MDNPVLEAIFNRRSVRAYIDKPVTDEQIDMLVQAALSAPSARNVQPWRFMVVKDREILAEMEQDAIEYVNEQGDPAMMERFAKSRHNLFYNAPAVVFIAIDQSFYSPMDAGIAVENMALAAQGMGLGSVIVAMARMIFEGSKAEYWKEKLQFPEGFAFAVSLVVGYADGEGQPHEMDISKATII